jgi:hypothetical protein
MSNEITFDEWHKAFKEKVEALGLPELAEWLAYMPFMEDLTVDEAIEQYKTELEQ